MKDYFPRQEFQRLGFSEVAIRILEKLVDLSNTINSVEATDTLLTDYVTVVRSVNADTTFAADDYTILVDASGGDIAVTLPTLAAKTIQVKKIDSSSNNVILSGDANIDGNATVEFNTQYQCITVTGGLEWYII